MQQVQLIKLFISCPNDIKEEVDSISLIIDEINKTSGRQNSYSLEFLNYLKDTYTQIGDDAQDVINKQLDPQYDILVGILWQKIGTKTKRDKSGTIEEINRAIGDKGKEFLIYFKITPPESINAIDLNQLKKVQKFKSDLSKKGVLYKEFTSTANFESLFRINIINLIHDKLLSINKKEIPSKTITKYNKYEDVKSAITHVEMKESINSVDLDVFEIVENILSSFNLVTNSLSSMTSVLNDLTGKMNLKAEQLTKLTSIKDDRLRIRKCEILINAFADELFDFNIRMRSEKQILIDHYLSIGPNYSKIIMFDEAYQTSEGINLRQSMSFYRDSVANATSQSANMLKIISTWPPTTAKFNKSKRETEVVIKDITKIFLEGLYLLDEALGI